MRTPSRWSRPIAACLPLASVFGLWAAPAAAQAAGEGSGYHRKQVAILEPSHDILYQMLAQKFIAQARFHYVELPYGDDPAEPEVSAFVAAFAAYLGTHATSKAAPGSAPDTSFGGVPVPGSQLDRVLGSSYVILPDWTVGAVEPGKEQESIDAQGDEELSTTLSVPLEVSIRVVNVASGLDEGKATAAGIAAKTVSTTIQKGASRLDREREVREYVDDRDRLASLPPQLGFADVLPAAGAGVLSDLMNQIKNLEAFRIRSYLVEGPDHSLVMALGAHHGIDYDSVYEVFRKAKEGDGFAFDPAGFVKIRDEATDSSSFDVIQDPLGLDAGDRLVEHPQTGYSGQVRLGMGTFAPAGGWALAPELSLVGELDLARRFETPILSELYLTGDLDGLLALPAAAGEVLAGIKKRFYFHQLVLSAGLEVGLIGDSAQIGKTVGGQVATDGVTTITPGSAIDVMGGGLGGGPDVGLAYQFNPELRLGVDVGYLLATPITPFKVTVVDAADASKTYDFNLDQLHGIPTTSANTSGPSCALSGEYSF